MIKNETNNWQTPLVCHLTCNNDRNDIERTYFKKDEEVLYCTDIAIFSKSKIRTLVNLGDSFKSNVTAMH